MRFHRLALTAVAALLSVGTPLYGGNNGLALAEDAAADAAAESTSASTPPEDAETFEFEAEVHRMLDIVVNSLYQNKDVFLRELISNASDALDKVRFLALTKPEFMEGKPELEVRIEYDEDAKTLTVRDSGIGMTHDDLVKNLGTVARSGTTKFIEAMGEGSADMGMIGQFGVGFYSTFLVADKVTVASKHPESDAQYVWESVNGSSEFFVAKDPRGNTLGRGTEITLHLKEDAEEYAAGDRVRNLAKYYSEFVMHPIHLRTSKMEEVEVEDEEEEGEAEEKKEGEEGEAEEEKEGEEGEEKKEEDDLEIDEEEEAEEKPKETKEVLTHSWEEVNTEQAIWTRSKEEITDEEYQGFWKKSLSKSAMSDAKSWIHFNAEGNINFKSILYLPDEVPPSLMQGNFDMERKGGLKLYVRKVLISDEFELMPKYLSFIKGVVDSDDLPLNVNRETLQESKIIKVISKKLVRKALEMLRKLADKDKAPAKKEDDEEKEVEVDEEGNVIETPEEDEEEDEIDRPKPYLEWYKKFAPSLKMGVIEDEANRGKLAKLLRFKSSKTEAEDEYISLPEYVERMKDWQDDVYVFAGQNIDELEKSHFMEQFLEKDVEVLYLTDPVDEYMIQSMRDFEGKKFTAISKEGIKFKDEDEDMVKRREKAYKKKFKPLTKWLNKLYGPSIMRVSISKRLGKAPAIVSSAEYGHSANMERIMRAQAFQHGQDEMMMRAMRVLEINPRHPFIEKLLEGCPPEEDEEASGFSVEESVEDAAWLLYDMALMNGGFPIQDTKDYSQRMTKVLQTVMGVEDLTLSEEISPPEEEDEPPEVDMDGNEGINLEDFDLDDASDEFEGVDI